MNVLVCGGAGYVGSHVLEPLKAAGFSPVVLDNLSYGHRAAVRDTPLVQGDIHDRAATAALLRERAIDAVFHFCAFINVGESVEEPEKYYFNNVVGTLELLAAMREAGVTRFVFSSTCAIYGEPQYVPMDEAHPTGPINPYGQTKLDIERALESYRKAYGLSYAALRYFNASGASPEGDIGEDHDPETHLIPLVMKTALGQRPALKVFGDDYDTRDGTAERDYIHVEDLAAAHILALGKLEEPGTGLHYNLGRGEGYTVLEIIEHARKITGREIPFDKVPRRPGDAPKLVSASARANSELGWRPKHDLDSILESAWRWHSTHPKGFGDCHAP
jgi:UDP-glucose 4-epimerase